MNLSHCGPNLRQSELAPARGCVLQRYTGIRYDLARHFIESLHDFDDVGGRGRRRGGW